MENKITIKIKSQDRQICYLRVVNSILEVLPEDYAYLEDVFDLQRLAHAIDYQLRKNQHI